MRIPKDQRRRLRLEIRIVADALRRHWDPIGLGAMPGLPADEYDSYAPEVLGMIERADPDASIAEHLGNLEAEDIGLERRPQAELLAIVKRVRAAVVADRAS